MTTAISKLLIKKSSRMSREGCLEWNLECYYWQTYFI